jgi:hypothetical protein
MPSAQKSAPLVMPHPLAAHPNINAMKAIVLIIVFVDIIIS